MKHSGAVLFCEEGLLLSAEGEGKKRKVEVGARDYLSVAGKFRA